MEGDSISTGPPGKRSEDITLKIITNCAGEKSIGGGSSNDPLE